jgi:hypothetical protein
VERLLRAITAEGHRHALSLPHIGIGQRLAVALAFPDGDIDDVLAILVHEPHRCRIAGAVVALPAGLVARTRTAAAVVARFDALDDTFGAFGLAQEKHGACAERESEQQATCTEQSQQHADDHGGAITGMVLRGPAEQRLRFPHTV